MMPFYILISVLGAVLLYKYLTRPKWSRKCQLTIKRENVDFDKISKKARLETVIVGPAKLPDEIFDHNKDKKTPRSNEQNLRAEDRQDSPVRSLFREDL